MTASNSHGQSDGQYWHCANKLVHARSLAGTHHGMPVHAEVPAYQAQPAQGSEPGSGTGAP
jgi:hypothetical protein